MFCSTLFLFYPCFFWLAPLCTRQFFDTCYGCRIVVEAYEYDRFFAVRAKFKLYFSVIVRKFKFYMTKIFQFPMQATTHLTKLSYLGFISHCNCHHRLDQRLCISAFFSEGILNTRGYFAVILSLHHRRRRGGGQPVAFETWTCEIKSMSEKTLGALADSAHAEEAYLVR